METCTPRVHGPSLVGLSAVVSVGSGQDLLLDEQIIRNSTSTDV